MTEMATAIKKMVDFFMLNAPQNGPGYGMEINQQPLHQYSNGYYDQSNHHQSSGHPHHQAKNYNPHHQEFPQ